jgi:hypothetical protein
MYQASEHNVPLYSIIGKLHIIYNGRLSTSGYAKETRKSVFESTLPTPNIFPEADLGSNPWVKSKVAFRGVLKEDITAVFKEFQGKGSLRKVLMQLS